ncbi:MAG: hypothetical protein H6Q72_617 [Firmicutes bacterium]|nr:hypothetical protein [Bacillota bacterium]
MPCKYIKPPSIDAYITRHRPAAKTMKRGYLLIGKHANSCFESISQWDLASIPDNLNIIGATANFYLANFDSSGSIEIEVYPIVSHWKPSHTSLKHPPLTSPCPIAVDCVSATSKQLSFGITALVKEWQCHKGSNFGILLRMKEPDISCQVISLFSGNYRDSRLWPYIEIMYNPPDEIPCIYKPETINISDTVQTANDWSYTKPLDIFKYNYTYIISNTGTKPAVVYLAVSADCHYWLEQSAKYTLAPGESAALVSNIITRFARVTFRSLNSNQKTTLSICTQGRTT